jgi:hypothetical protein
MAALLDVASTPADVAACTADRVIVTIGPQLLIAIDSSGPTDPRLAQVQQASAKAALACGYTGPQRPTSG